MAVSAWLFEWLAPVLCKVRRQGILVGILIAVGCGSYSWESSANQPEVLFVELERQGSHWTVHVTVRHNDRGWEHYADAWRILGPAGEVLGTRTLYHPHENEQPFRRSLSGVKIPDSYGSIEVQAHDKVHGWGEKLRIDLTAAEGEKFRIR